MKNKKSMRKLLSGLLAIVMAACMLMGMATTAGAANQAANQAVMDAKNGVVQIQIWFKDVEFAVEEFLGMGTGFLINDQNVVTCDHVANYIDDAFLVEWARESNLYLEKPRSASELRECVEIRVVIYRDVTFKATVVRSSTELDYAILALEQKITGRTPLKIRSSSTVQQTETVYALGFPGEMVEITSVKNLDADDVTITTGAVNSVSNLTFVNAEGREFENVNFVESSALITGGNSGGPLVDSNGAVIGINSQASDTRNLAISSDELLKVLQMVNIPYTPVDPDPITPVPTDPVIEDTTIAPTVPGPVVDTTVPTTVAPATTEKEEDTEPEKEGLDPMVIAIAGAAAVVIILIIILIVVSSKKKKAAPAPAPVAAPAPSVPRAAQPQPRPQPQPQPAMPNRVPVTAPARAASPETSLLNAGIGETTVLGAGSGETTVLSQSVNGGVLVRASNNERIPVNTADFTVGRERSRVDYCIGGNTNISREHARFVVRNGHTYIIDNKTANGTFVNGIKARPGQEIELRSGDKIMLADETFEFVK